MTKKEMEETLGRLAQAKKEGARQADIDKALEGWHEANVLMEENIKSLQLIARLEGKTHLDEVRSSQLSMWINEIAEDGNKRYGMSNIELSQLLHEWCPEMLESVKL